MHAYTRMHRTNRPNQYLSRGLRLLGHLVLALSLLPSCLQAEVQAEQLLWKLEAGRQYRIVSDRSVRQSSSLAQWTDEVRSVFVWNVTNVLSDGTMELTQTLAEVKQSFRWADGEPIVFDSTIAKEPVGEAAALSRQWKPQLNVERRIRLSPRGQWSVVGPTNASTLGESPSSAPVTPPPAPPPSAAPATAQPASSANASATSPAIARPAQLLLPDEDLKPGSEWSDTMSFPWGDVADAWQWTAAYTFQGNETIDGRDLSKIAVTGQLQNQPGSGTTPIVSLERQSAEGLILFDATAGYLVDSQMTHDLTVRLRRPDATNLAGDLSFIVHVRIEPIALAVPAAEPNEPARPKP